MKTILTSFLLVMYFTGSSQEFEEADFGWYGTKSIEERNKIFPFNRVKKVMLVSYSNLEFLHPLNPKNSEYIDITINEAREYDRNYLSKIVFKPAIYFTLEEKVLSKGSIDELSHILCNYILKPGQEDKQFFSEMVMCYTPRNSILFFDEADNIISCFEICFDCNNSGFWPDPAGFNDPADLYGCHIYDILNDFFRRNGIKYGIEQR